MSALLIFTLLLASPAPKVSCVARSNQVVSFDRVTRVTTERDVWTVDCTGAGKKPLSETYLTFHAAMTAIAKFRGECDRECQDRCFKKGECEYGWKP